MKHSNTWFALILIASVSPLSAASGAVENAVPRSSPPAITKKRERQAADNQNVAAQQPAASPSRPSAQPCQPTGSNNKQLAKESWWWPPLPSSWVLILVTGAYAVISFYTLGAIAEQAAIARDELEKLERPWIMALPTRFEIVPSSGNALTTRWIKFAYSVQNTGRSPAWIIGGGGKAIKIAKDSLPDTPDYGPLGRGYGLTPTPPNDKGREEWAQLKFSGEEFQALVNGKLNFVIFGFMNYRDAVAGKILLETRFCICLEPGPNGLGMAFCGPDSYNRYT